MVSEPVPVKEGLRPGRLGSGRLGSGRVSEPVPVKEGLRPRED